MGEVMQHAKGQNGRIVGAAQHEKQQIDCSVAAYKGKSGTRLTCSSLGNGSKGYEQHQQLRAREVQQAGGAPSGEEEGR